MLDARTVSQSLISASNLSAILQIGYRSLQMHVICSAHSDGKETFSFLKLLKNKPIVFCNFKQNISKLRKPFILQNPKDLCSTRSSKNIIASNCCTYNMVQSL